MSKTLVRLRELGAEEIVNRTGFSRSAVYDALGGTKPHPRNRALYESIH
jgi:hypothetical protein